MTQDEWVVCRVFAKSAGAKKYPSNNAHSRSHHHPYTLDMVPPLLPTLLQHDPFARGPHHLYMTPADLAELARFARGTPGLHPPIQPHPGAAAALHLHRLNVLLLTDSGTGSVWPRRFWDWGGVFLGADDGG